MKIGKSLPFNYKQLKRFNALTNMLPNENHPLTLAYIAGARARTHEAINQVLRIVKSLEQVESEITRAQCKLAAEVTMERSGEWSIK